MLNKPEKCSCAAFMKVVLFSAGSESDRGVKNLLRSRPICSEIAAAQLAGPLFNAKGCLHSAASTFCTRVEQTRTSEISDFHESCGDAHYRTFGRVLRLFAERPVSGGPRPRDETGRNLLWRLSSVSGTSSSPPSFEAPGGRVQWQLLPPDWSLPHL